MRGDTSQVGLEGAALVFCERSEQLLLDLLGSVPGLLEPVAATSGELDQVATAVDGITAANDEPLSLEAVDHGHQVARVDAQRLTEAALGGRAALREGVEDRELLGMHAELAERRAEAYRGCPPQAEDQQVAAARIGVAVEGVRGVGGRRAHLGAMVPSRNSWRI